MHRLWKEFWKLLFPCHHTGLMLTCIHICTASCNKIAKEVQLFFEGNLVYESQGHHRMCLLYLVRDEKLMHTHCSGSLVLWLYDLESKVSLWLIFWWFHHS